MAFGFPTLRQPALVTYGTGSIKSLGRTGDWDRTVLLLSGSSAVEDYLQQAWKKTGPDPRHVFRLHKPAGEPTWASLQTAAETLAAAAPSRLIAIGGGAVLDWARLAWLAAQGALTATGEVADAPLASARRDVAFVLVPTTCGSGAEAAAVAVFTDAAGRKVPVVSPALLADEVVLDSRFLTTVPEATLASSLADAISHAIEAWMSVVPGRLPKEAAISCLQLIFEDGHQSERHARLMDAGYLGGLAAAHCSVGIVHAFAHSAATYGLTHGHANAVALVPGLRRLLPLPAGTALARRLGMDTATLIDRVTDAIAPALRHPDTARVLAIVDGADRRALVDAMLSDRCMRTCPLPFSADEVSAFLDDIRATVAQAC